MKLSASVRVLVASVVVGVSLISSAFGAAYMKFDGIPGESTHDGHKDWIELIGLSHEIMGGGVRTQSARAGSGAPTFGDIVVTKELDKSTPKLMQACASGKHIPRCVVEFVSSDRDNPRTYYKITMSDVLVSSYSSTSGDGVPTESLSLNFTKIEWTYTSQGADGKPEEISGGWDVQANKPL